ncbi:response regulator transcription factor [Ramlibacter solisilvae]|uniref:response regulator transcription factor n=1 Tax=Ramlibacter tataouinensis TaxID=94132 RepID=UPI0009EED580|nr:response regulator [Ramlibacter tataouinensis]
MDHIPFSLRAADTEATCPQPAQVHVVDDDASVRGALARLLDGRGWSVFAHASAESFVSSHDPEAHGCIVLDVAMPGLDGLALQQLLARNGELMPIIFLTGCADVPMCAGAMREGAIDFLTKPVDEEVLLAAVERGLERDFQRRSARERQHTAEERLSTLTPREREVLTHVMEGRLNKQIAADLGTAEKTVKVHRARAMEKMHVRSVAELVRLVERGRPDGSA